MNKDAGRGGLLKVVVRLASGEKVRLVMDTGAPVTAFIIRLPARRWPVETAKSLADGSKQPHNCGIFSPLI